jgi:RNA polymerase sigma-70 factor (ECF subfamily)
MNPQKKFKKIYDKNVESIYRFVFLKVSKKETAEDLTSETFKKGWEVFKENPNMDNPRAYLYKIARNGVIDHYRTKKQHLSPDDLQLEDDHKNIQEIASQNQQVEKIKEAMKSLKDNYQDIIIYRYLEELEISEIAQILDKSEGAVRVTIHRATEALKKEIDK